MAIRGKVKDVKTDPANMRSTGTVTDTSTRTDYPFVQAFGEQLGLVKDMIVQFETVVSDGVTYGTSLNPSDEGEVKSIITADAGVLINVSGDPIEFEQPFLKELGIVENSKVIYTVVYVGGKFKATNLKLTTNQ